MKKLFQNKLAVLCLVLSLVLLILGGSILAWALLDPFDCRIMPGVTVGGLDIGGMRPREARKALAAAADETFLRDPLVITLPQEDISLTPQDAGLSLSVRDAVNAAWKIGRDGGANTPVSLPLGPYLKLNTEFVRSQLQAYADKYDTDLTQPSFTLTGEAPVLSSKEYTEGAPVQTLTVTKGIPTVHLDVDAATAAVIAEYDLSIGEHRSGCYGIRVDTPALEVPALPDLEAIRKEVSIAPVNDTLDMKTYQLVHGAYGYSFDMAEARSQLRNIRYGQEFSIPMIYVRPDILGEEAYFRDVLGSCDTKHTTNENRNTNLRLLCAAINGTILQPGEEFSYNETVGERTKERGYKAAPAYSGNRLTDAIGGGVCQGSTTLYNCVLYADLEVVHRLCHGARVTYVPLGLDATVNWGTTDFKFKNSSNFPIKLLAEVSDGYVRMKIMGTDEKDYYIKMETRTGEDDVAIYASSWKCKYDKKTDELISRDLEARSTYYKNIG